MYLPSAASQGGGDHLGPSSASRRAQGPSLRFRLAISFSISAVGFDRPPPAIGEHKSEIHGSILGFSRDELCALGSAGVGFSQSPDRQMQGINLGGGRVLHLCSIKSAAEANCGHSARTPSPLE